ncbi:leucine-rich repeat domain-containing protein [Elstera sp.]|uniref:leucine-rich repeat domain-containing protein n=1 Tax=Elstera sp. TaxID=1916664 RepID=UPI0037BF820A
MPIIPEFDGTNGYEVARARIAKEAQAQTGVLDLEGLELEALPPELAMVRHLQALDFSNNPLTSLDGLQHCPELQSLDCSSTEITSLDGLQHCPMFQSLACSSTEITNLDGLQHCPELQNLGCWNTPIISLDGLQHCPELQSLTCWGTLITSLDGLQHCPELQNLGCWNTPIISLDGLQHCPKLQSLDCSYTQITDIAPLSACLELKKFEALETCLTTVPPGFWDRHALQHVEISSLNGVPSELLSEDYEDNCLQRLRDYLTDRETGSKLIRDVKLFLLGNGGTGKTQMARHLRREPFNPAWDSTHGIQVTTATLTGDEEHPESSILHLWDFGGQELYHSTHALFLRNRALFLLLWSPDKEPETAETLYADPLDYWSRNYPRSYWFDQIAEHAGTNSPVLRVQSKCETHKSEQSPSLEEGQRFAFFRSLAFGAANRHRARDLKSAIRDGLDYLRETTGEFYIGQSWAEVQRAIEALRAADGTYAPENQLRSRDWFRDLCTEKGVKTGDATILTYLHRCGILFYHPGLFGDQIIIDQAWVNRPEFAGDPNS